MQAIAKAFAIAIAGISAECTIEGHGTACAVGFSEITQAAEARFHTKNRDMDVMCLYVHCPS